MTDSQTTDKSAGDDATETPAGNAPKASRRKIALIAAMSLVAVLAGYLVLAPSPIDPVAYTPPTKPEMAGPLEPNTILRDAEFLAMGQVPGPEDVDVDGQGRIYAGTVDGKIVRISPDGEIETFAQTGGRPFGMDFDGAGNLIVCDGIKGLLSLNPDGHITTLVTQADGVDLGFADDVDVAGDGMIYFSDASSNFGVDEYVLDLLEGRPHGRLLRYDPQSKKTTVLVDKLYFANGVAVALGGEFVLVNETYRYRVTRYWLKGAKAGTSDTFADNLPGFPDGVSTSPRGTFWVAMLTLRNDAADFMAPRPSLRTIVSKLPRAVWPKPAPYGLLLELDGDGKIIRSMHDPGGHQVSVVTSVHEYDGHLYLGTLSNDWIARLKLPAE